MLAHIDAHLCGETAAYAYDYRLCHEDGGWVWIAAEGRAIRDANGRAVRYAGIMTDITGRRWQEERLRASRERQLSILDASPIAVNITRRDGSWVFCNAQSLAILGHDRDELMRTPSRQLYADPADRDALIARYEREGPFREAEIRLRKPDGTISWVLSSWGEVDLEDERDSRTIRIDARPDGDEHVILEIADDGCGVAPDSLSRIFETFFTTRRGAGGSGLGLHIVRRSVCGVLGGSVTVASAPGQGTHFTLTLPRTAPGAEQPAFSTV